MDWLTEELKQKVRKVFEPRYKRSLTDFEVEEIAQNYASFFEGLAKYSSSVVTIEGEGSA